MRGGSKLIACQIELWTNWIPCVWVWVRGRPPSVGVTMHVCVSMCVCPLMQTDVNWWTEVSIKWRITAESITYSLFSLSVLLIAPRYAYFPSLLSSLSLSLYVYDAWSSLDLKKYKASIHCSRYYYTFNEWNTKFSMLRTRARVPRCINCVYTGS